MKVAEAAKKVADFQWREWNDLAIHIQSLYQRASRTQTFAKITLGDGTRPVLGLPFADTHIGARGTNYRIFRKMTEEIISTPDLYLMIIGDFLEFAVKLRSVAEVCAQIIGPDKQVQFMEDWLDEVKDKLAFATWCNHGVEREEKQSGISIIKNMLADRTVMFDGIGHADIRVGTQVYKIATSHKFRGYSYLNAAHAGQRYMRFQGVDREIAIMGDKHTPAYNWYSDGPIERLSLVTGTLNLDSLYAKRYFSIFTQPHFPCIEFHHKRHLFTAFQNLESWKMNRGK